jgi:uncharacterized protein
MSESRIKSLDQIRGLAILGILMVNVISFAMPMDVYMSPIQSPLGMSEADSEAWWIVHTFFESKFITLFALLFGVSLYLVAKDDRPETPFNKRVIFWRLLSMAGFGFIHGALIWMGDILLMYAIVGFIFWQAIRLKRLWLWGGLLYILSTGLIVLMGYLLNFLPPEKISTAMAQASTLSFDEEMRLMQGGFTQSLTANFYAWSDNLASILMSYGPKVLALMMIGLSLFKAGYFEPKGKTLWHVFLIILGSIAIAIMGYQAHITIDEGYPEPQVYGIYRTANEALSIFGSLGYASALILLNRFEPTRFIGWLLGPVGRMAFTNYLTQSLIMTVIFYGGRSPEGWGLGLFGTISHAQLVPFVIGVWGFQIIFSHLWLKLFKYGPFEWLWRCLSHRQFVNLR